MTFIWTHFLPTFTPSTAQWNHVENSWRFFPCYTSVSGGSLTVVWTLLMEITYFPRFVMKFFGDINKFPGLYQGFQRKPANGEFCRLLSTLNFICVFTYITKSIFITEFECRKWHFRASRFQNFLGKHAPTPLEGRVVRSVTAAFFRTYRNPSLLHCILH